MPEIRNPAWLTRQRIVLEWDYDPETGVFTRVSAGGNRVDRIGASAGVIQRGYRYLAVAGTHVLAHRMAWFLVNGKWPKRWVVHLNGDRDDNRIANLAYKEKPKYETPDKRLTQERLREVLAYDPATGILTWKVGTSRGRVGAQAGVTTKLGYRYVAVDARKYLAHRLAWLHYHGKWPNKELDHINGNRDDNRIANLREANKYQNAHNSPRAVGATGYRGVRQKGRRFQAIITARNRRISLGWFATAEEAHAAYVEGARKHHGEFVNGG